MKTQYTFPPSKRELFPKALLLKVWSEPGASASARILLEMQSLRPISDQLNQNMVALHIKG